MMSTSKSFIDKYTSDSKKAEVGEDKKVILSEEGYAIGVLLEGLINTINVRGRL